MNKPAVAAKEHPASSNEIKPGFVGVVISNTPYQQVNMVETAMKKK